MADVTVEPSTLELALTQQAMSLPGATHTSFVSTFALALTRPPSRAICSFPVISRKPSHAFSDEPTGKAVLIGNVASGYPVLNKLFTFDPRTFTPELRFVPEADKQIIMQFYESHKDVTFPWYNDQDHTEHEVAFASKPRCRIDGRRDRWRISLNLLKCAP